MPSLMSKELKNHPLHLIETLSGKTIARSNCLDDLRGEICEADAERYTVHHDRECWFAPASIIFKEKAAAKPTNKRTHTSYE